MILSLALGRRDAIAGLTETARQAERAGVDLLLAGYPRGGLESGVLPADPAALDPLSVASALIGVTSRIGLAAVVPTAGWAPFNMARAFSALDNLSAGRAGWFSIAGEDADRGRFAEHLQVTFALMESWDLDALIFDKTEAVFTDPAKVHRVAHAGRYFTVDGPLNSPRSPQGRPFLLQAAGPEAEQADIMVTRPPRLDAARGAGRAGQRVIVDLTFSLTGAEIGPDASLAYSGEPAGLADLMRAWASACDGFNLLPARPADVAAFAEHAAPILRGVGLIRERTGPTLRTRLELTRVAEPALAVVS